MTRSTSIEGGETRISLKACIQLPVASAEAHAPTAELIELIEVRQLDLELQGGSLPVTTRQRNQHPGIEAVGAGRLDLAPDEVDRALPVNWQHVIAKAGQIHGQYSS